MLEDELYNLVLDIQNKQCEQQTIELKEAHVDCPKRLYDTLSSFANQDGGGIIIFGLSERDHYNVCGVYDPQDLQKKVSEQAEQMLPIIRPLFTVCQIDHKIVVSAEIGECDIFDKPCFYKGAGKLRGSYVRVGDMDKPMTEYEIYSYETFKRKIQDELRIVERADRDEFEPLALNDYFFKIRQTKPNLAKLDEARILKLQGIIVDDRPTIAGIMLFGFYPQAFFPQLCLTAMQVAGTEIGDLGEHNERFIDNKKIEGTIPQMLQEAINFVRRNMKIATIINPQTGKREDKTEYPITAVREILLNALIHRDYSIHTDNSPIRLILYSDRLELENPGGLYGRITIDQLGKMAADTRNPFIASALEVLLGTENRFSGIPTIYKELEKANMPKPVFQNQQGVFKVIFQKTLSQHTISDKMSLDLLAYCSTARTREEIAHHFGFASPSYLIKKYVQPLIEAGFIKQTLPDAPKSKNQRYFTS